MGKIKKEKPKPHIIIPDTSILWHEDKHHIVTPDFDLFWSSYAEKFGLELVIPEVVKGELLFQQTTSALKSLKKANQSIQDVERVTHRKYSHSISENRVRQEVEKKFQRWAESKSAKVLPTPTNVIIWTEIIKKSIWREVPFLFDQQDGDNEKGFRDCMILETVKHFCSQEQRDITIAFLCKDTLLKDATEAALSNDKRFSVYELVSDFKTYLDLTIEKLEDVFIKTIVKRASDKFFAKGDPECLYFRDNVKNILQEKYRKYFDNPEESEDKLYGLIFPSGQRKWESTYPGTFWISRSQFRETDSAGQYIWLNTVTYVKQYARTESVGLYQDRTTGRQLRVLILPFFITWRAGVTSDGRFWEYSYLNDELKGNKFKEPSDEERKNWNLEEPKS